MKHIEVRQKYSIARRFFNYLLVVSSGDELLRLVLDILPHVLQETSQEVSRRRRTVDVKEMK